MIEAEAHRRAEIVSERLVYENWVRLFLLIVRMPNGELVERHVEDHGPAVAVLPYDPVRRTALLVTQPRPPVLRVGEEDELLEVIAGLIEPIGIEATVYEEALDEAGVRLGALEWVTNIWSMPSISAERIHLYLAPYSAADRIGAGGGAADENEAITVVEMPLAQLAAAVADGSFTDAKSLVLAQALQLRHPELFA